MLNKIRHIRSKLMLIVLMAILTALTINSAVLLLYDLRTYQASWVEDVITQADVLGQTSAAALAFDDRQAAQENLRLMRLRPQILAAAIYTTRGELFATYQRDEATAPRFPKPAATNISRIEDGQLIVFRQIRRSDEVLGTMYLCARYELFERMKSYLSILGIVMGISLITTLLISTQVQAIFTQPILRIADVARQVISRKDFSLRANKTTEDEIGDLVEAFNAMLTEIDNSTVRLEQSNNSLKTEMLVRREAEAALMAADQRKDEFLATLAHELRNPLAPIRNALDLLRFDGIDAAKKRTAHDMMDRQLRQMVRLVDDLLDVSRITTGKMVLRKERISLQAVLQSAIDTARPLIDGQQQRLVVTMPSAIIALQGDPVRLAQVFTNLLNNASKFTHPGGLITVGAETREDCVLLSIGDDGIGISANMLKTIFDMFSQADGSLERTHSGLGVGLTLARHLIELHGGTIEASSAGLGHGSRFTVRLPVIRSAAAAAAHMQDR